MLRVQRRVFEAGEPSHRACEAARLLGYSVDTPPTAPEPDVMEVSLASGTITLIEGPSGSGKSCLLGDITRAAAVEDWGVIDAARIVAEDRACVDLFDTPVEAAMRRLAMAGLAEAGVFVRRAGVLSAGQAARLRIALAMERAERAGGRSLVVIDELGSGLDTPTAMALAGLLRRWVTHGSECCVVAATARDDLTGPLRPDKRIVLDLFGRATTMDAAGTYEAFRVDVEQGGTTDYVALARLHYRAGAPATAVRILRAGVHGRLAGVLVVSMPALNASWRRTAWGDRFASGDRGRDARRLNREVRCISRVVVDPRWRGLGVARSLVRAYLDEPMTPCTEVVAAMGRACGFFGAAGMTPIAIEPAPRDRRLLAALCGAGIESWRLAMPRWVAEHLEGDSRMEEELRRWARASRATSRNTGAPVAKLVELACRGVGAARTAYVYGNPSERIARRRGAA